MLACLSAGCANIGKHYLGNKLPDSELSIIKISFSIKEIIYGEIKIIYVDGVPNTNSVKSISRDLHYRKNQYHKIVKVKPGEHTFQVVWISPMDYPGGYLFRSVRDSYTCFLKFETVAGQNYLITKPAKKWELEVKSLNSNSIIFKQDCSNS